MKINEEKFTPRYQELDALRGVAALSTVFFHFTLDRPEAKFGFELGATGVDLFFIISGFVIFMSLNKVSSTLEFLVNRFTRLYPTYWTCVTFTFLLQVLVAWKTGDAHPTALDYMGNMTMFQYYLRIPDLDGPYWTMAVELIFYLCMALIFALGKLKYILPVGLFILAATVVNDIWLESWHPAFHKIHFIFPLITHFPLFLAGIVFYKLMNDTGGYKKKGFYYACLVICFSVKLLLSDDGGRTLLFTSFNQYLCCLIVYFSLFILFVNHKLTFIVSRPTLFLGKISFALYLIQLFVSLNVVLPGLMNHAHFGFWPAAFVALAVIILLATVITYYIEIPAGKWMNRVLRSALGLQQRGAAG